MLDCQTKTLNNNLQFFSKILNQAEFEPATIADSGGHIDQESDNALLAIFQYS